MISFIRGNLVEKYPTIAVVECSKVGMEVLIPLSTYEVLGQAGSEIFLFTYLHVREDALTLFGFATQEERRLFRELLTVSGIGPKLALGVLSGSKVSDVYRRIADGDEAALTRIPGIGKKTAQRLIIDLKDKAIATMKKMAPVTLPETKISPDILEEAMLALMTLGYARNEAQKAIIKAAERAAQTATVEDLVRIALKG
jgi:Holliday junction DNA helicase RuvA